MKVKSSLPYRPSLSLALILCLLVSLLAAPAVQAVQPAGGESYIVQASDASQSSNLVEAVGGEVTSRLDLIHGVGARLSPAAVAALRANPAVTGLTANNLVKASMSDGEPGGVRDKANIPATDYPDEVGADVAWGQGVTGAGVSVAVLDTGLGWVPGVFQDVEGRNKSRVVAWKDFVEGKLSPHDPNGHGTHIAGIIANTEVGADGEWDGVAPGVGLVGVRVLNEEGAGTYEQVIEGLQWVVEHRAQYNIRVINLSLFSPAQSPYWADPLNQAVMQAWAAGITVVVAAGNQGPGPMSIGVPGNNPYVITVGAFTDNHTPANWNDDYIAPFSAAGPTLDGFVKPDLVAPGAHMVSNISPSSYIARQHEANRVGARYFSMAGTSQAAAVVSGVAALALSAHPGLTPDQVKYRLMVTAFPWVDPSSTKALYSIWQQGAGRVNAPDAVSADLQGQANAGMNLQADLAGTTHYEGYSYFDPQSGQFRLRGEFADWSGGYWTWDGGYGIWSGGYGIWSGGYGIWSGGYGIWSGGYGIWSGGYGIWSGGYGIWSGGYGIWSGSGKALKENAVTPGSPLPYYADPIFVADFLAGKGPDASTVTTSINYWVDEPLRTK